MQGKQGVVKHLYLGILFIYNESESENCGFFCAQCGSCEKIRKDLGNSTGESSVCRYGYLLVIELEMFFVSLSFFMYQDVPTPMFSEPAYEQTEHRDSKRFFISSVILPACKCVVLISFII